MTPSSPKEIPDPAGFHHITVLRAEVAEAVAAGVADRVQAADAEAWVVDATLGGGGHAEAILVPCHTVRLLGLDRDPTALAAATVRLAPFGGRFTPVHARFGELVEVVATRGAGPLAAVVADLGVSSHQLDTPERGFSFRNEGPLDMRMDPTRGQTVAELLAEVTLEDLADVLYDYGDIRRSIGTARIVLQSFQGGAVTTSALAEKLAARLPRTRSMHPATQVFQALRIWANRELDELERLLADAPGLLAPGGVLAVISFHSGEDRLVKRAMQAQARRDGWLRRTKRSVMASEAEQTQNPRARSARLRVLQRAPLAGLGTRQDGWDEEEEGEVDEGGQG